MPNDSHREALLDEALEETFPAGDRADGRLTQLQFGRKNSLPPPQTPAGGGGYDSSEFPSYREICSSRIRAVGGPIKPITRQHSTIAEAMNAKTPTVP